MFWLSGADRRGLPRQQEHRGVLPQEVLQRPRQPQHHGVKEALRAFSERLLRTPGLTGCQTIKVPRFLEFIRHWKVQKVSTFRARRVSASKRRASHSITRESCSLALHYVRHDAAVATSADSFDIANTTMLLPNLTSGTQTCFVCLFVCVVPCLAAFFHIFQVNALYIFSSFENIR